MTNNFPYNFETLVMSLFLTSKKKKSVIMPLIPQIWKQVLYKYMLCYIHIYIIGRYILIYLWTLAFFLSW